MSDSQGGQISLSSGGEGQVEVPPSSPPWLVTEWVRSKIEKLAVPQYYFNYLSGREDEVHLSRLRQSCSCDRLFPRREARGEKRGPGGERREAEKRGPGKERQEARGER